MARARNTASAARSAAVEEALENVRGLLRQLDVGPESRSDWEYRFARLGTVVWPDGLDRRHLADMPLAKRSLNRLRAAGLLCGMAALTTADLLLRNFGVRSYRDLLVGIERFLEAPAADAAPRVPLAASSDRRKPARRAGAVEVAPVEFEKSGAGLRRAVAIMRGRVSAVVAAMSPAQRFAVRCRFIEEPQPTFAEIGRRLGVTRSRAHQLGAGVEWRAYRAVRAEAPFASDMLRRQLGHVVDERVFHRHLEKVLGRDDGLAERLLRKLMLERMGYVQSCGVYLDDEADAVIVKVRDHARTLADDAGLVDASELLELLPDLDWRSHWQVLRDRAGLHCLYGTIAVKDVAKARVKAALLSIGRPATCEEIAGACGLTGGKTRQCLWTLPSVVKASKDRWGLDDLMDTAYEGIVSEIARRIREDGGETTTKRVLTEIPAGFGVRPESVRNVLHTPRFLVRNGRVCFADERSMNFKPLDEVAHGRDADGAPWWSFCVRSRFLEGFSVTGLPREFAKALGCVPDSGILVRIDNLPGCRDLSVHWRLTSHNGASLGRIAGALRALGMRAGERARVTLKGPGVVGLTVDEEAGADGRAVSPESAKRARPT